MYVSDGTKVCVAAVKVALEAVKDPAASTNVDVTLVLVEVLIVKEDTAYVTVPGLGLPTPTLYVPSRPPS